MSGFYAQIKQKRNVRMDGDSEVPVYRDNPRNARKQISKIPENYRHRKFEVLPLNHGKSSEL